MKKFTHFKTFFLKVFLVVFAASFSFQAMAANVYINSAYAQSIKLSVSLNNQPISELFKQIEQNSEFVIIYSPEIVNTSRKVSVDSNEATIEQILNKAFANTPYTYSINDRQIAISKSSTPSPVTTTKLATDQQRKVTGKVLDENDKPLTGVMVEVIGRGTGNITDQDGAFSVIANEDQTLRFSFIGYKPQEISARANNLNVKMEVDALDIDEVVVVGYGTMRKKDLTGAISNVSGENIVERKSMQVSQALQGAVSGVMVTRNSNAPGASSGIKIRGITTIGNSEPLVIVDGVPVGDVNQVNPSDIETLTVLKDAASASIYGSRAASGVILITTKRAKNEQISLNYSYEVGFETPTQQTGLQSATEYMSSLNELRWNDLGNGANKYPTYAQDVIENYAELNAKDPNKYPDTNWRNLILKDKATRQSHNVSISAGSKVVKSNVSIRYDKIDGLFANKQYERITARSNNDFTINKYIGATLDVNFKRSINRSPNEDPFYNMNLAPAIYPAVWADGRIADGKSGNNPYAASIYGGTNSSWYNQIGGKAALDIKPIDGLKLSAILAPTFNFSKSKNFRKQVSVYESEDPTQFLRYIENHAATKLSEGRNDDYSLTTQFLANYNKDFGKHSLSIMAGYENFYSKYENLGASRDEYLLQNYPYLNIGPLTYRDNSGSAGESAYRSVFGRAVYSYNNRYLIQANVRYDGSSRFARDYRWGLFPSVSGGWVMSEEKFMKNQKTISYLKLRASWGTLGNERIGDYPYQATMAFGSALFYQGNDIVSKQTAAQVKYAINDISWEKTQSTNIGVDINLFDNRFRITGEYYFKKTKDMLLALEIPKYVGFENPQQNTGTMSTRGFDLDLGWSDQVNDFSYSVNFNLSQFKSKMGDLGGTEFLGDVVKYEGSEFNECYRSNGLFQNQADVDASPKLNANTKPGDVKFVDVSGPDGVPDGKISADYDRVLLGGSLPQFMFGANFSFGYKGIDLGIALQGVGKQNTHLKAQLQPNGANWGVFPTEIVGKSWSAYNTDEQNAGAKYPRYSQNNLGINYAMSDFWLFNGGYLRVKNITLGYTIPTRFTEKLLVKNLRFYISANDVLCFSKYPKGYDPELGMNGYPITATFLGGVSITF
ncbi:MAG: TonB-dependent receptor [Rikenellaceae bacterium]